MLMINYNTGSNIKVGYHKTAELDSESEYAILGKLRLKSFYKDALLKYCNYRKIAVAN